MIRSIVSLIAAVGMLTGCAALPFNINTIQSAAVGVCSFLPAANTISALIAANIPGLNTVEALANAICAAVAPRGVRSSGKPMVGGVVIEGQFTTR